MRSAGLKWEKGDFGGIYLRNETDRVAIVLSLFKKGDVSWSWANPQRVRCFSSDYAAVYRNPAVCTCFVEDGADVLKRGAEFCDEFEQVWEAVGCFAREMEIEA